MDTPLIFCVTIDKGKQDWKREIIALSYIRVSPVPNNAHNASCMEHIHNSHLCNDHKPCISSIELALLSGFNSLMCLLIN